MKLHAHPVGRTVRSARSERVRRREDHVVYDPAAIYDILDITDANVDDAVAERIEIDRLAYVFDKGYCRYGWWSAITRPRLSSSQGPRPTWA